MSRIVYRVKLQSLCSSVARKVTPETPEDFLGCIKNVGPRQFRLPHQTYPVTNKDLTNPVCCAAQSGHILYHWAAANSLGTYYTVIMEQIKRCLHGYSAFVNQFQLLICGVSGIYKMYTVTGDWSTTEQVIT